MLNYLKTITCHDYQGGHIKTTHDEHGDVTPVNAQYKGVYWDGLGPEREYIYDEEDTWSLRKLPFRVMTTLVSLLPKRRFKTGL